MKKLLTYLIPQTKNYTSEVNGTLEVTVYRGKKILDSNSANYSYGELHKILDVGLNQVKIKENANILVLGLGAGCVVQTLREKKGFNGKIIGVEKDPVVIKIAKEEFDIERFDNLEIVCADALSYLNKSNDIFDLIIIDVLVDRKVPRRFFEELTWLEIQKHLNPQGGAFIFNAGFYKELQDEIDNLIPVLNQFFYLQRMDLVMGTNTLLVGQKK